MVVVLSPIVPMSISKSTSLFPILILLVDEFIANSAAASMVKPKPAFIATPPATELKVMAPASSPEVFFISTISFAASSLAATLK